MNENLETILKAVQELQSDAYERHIDNFTVTLSHDRIDVSVKHCSSDTASAFNTTFYEGNAGGANTKNLRRLIGYVQSVL